MSYRVSELSGLCGILVARRASSLAGLHRRQQLDFYKKCDRVLPPLKLVAHRLQPDGSEKAPLHKEVAASHVLSKCKTFGCCLLFFLGSCFVCQVKVSRFYKATPELELE